MEDELDYAIYTAMKEKGLIPDKPVGIARSPDGLKLMKCTNVPNKRHKKNSIRVTRRLDEKIKS
jgi:hypothetical protein